MSDALHAVRDALGVPGAVAAGTTAVLALFAAVVALLVWLDKRSNR